MTPAKAKAKTNETFIVQASLTIITFDCQNIFIVQATGKVIRLFQFRCLWFKFNFYDFECNMISRLYVITNHALSWIRVLWLGMSYHGGNDNSFVVLFILNFLLTSFPLKGDLWLLSMFSFLYNGSTSLLGSEAYCWKYCTIWVHLSANNIIFTVFMVTFSMLSNLNMILFW
jgi:hypothetical protein